MGFFDWLFGNPGLDSVEEVVRAKKREQRQLAGIFIWSEALSMAEAYDKKSTTAMTLFEVNGIHAQRELTKIQPEHPIKLFTGKTIIWPFSVATISEKFVELKAAWLGGCKYLNLHARSSRCSPYLYWKVGRDLPLEEAEKLRNGQDFEIKIRMKSATWHTSSGDYDPSQCVWIWEFVDYPDGDSQSFEKWRHE